ncbi:hypothetical protein FKM82_007923 [Ascaphus truei]
MKVGINSHLDPFARKKTDIFTIYLMQCGPTMVHFLLPFLGYVIFALYGWNLERGVEQLPFTKTCCYSKSVLVPYVVCNKCLCCVRSNFLRSIY